MLYRKGLAIGLLAFSIATQAATSMDLVKTTRSWDGQMLPAYTLNQPEVTIKKITVAPGEKLPWHQHPVINAGILLSGELRVTTTDQVLELKEGDTIIEVMNTSHFGENTGKTPAEIIVFYLAEKGAEVTVLDKK
ncbi:cupin domain-containing protein [Photobacterium alginatilyticum]|uniref:cupin domain-containing protein n=1 Tax=Photobacterium alginatilyticum TaxID=1775171 RepID=UPI004068A07B